MQPLSRVRLRTVTIRLLSVVASTSILLNLAGQAGAETASIRPDPTNVINMIEEGKNGSLGTLSQAPIPQSGFYTSPRDPRPKSDAGIPGDPDRTSPGLDKLVASGSPNQLVSVLSTCAKIRPSRACQSCRAVSNATAPLPGPSDVNRTSSWTDCARPASSHRPD